LCDAIVIRIRYPGALDATPPAPHSTSHRLTHTAGRSSALDDNANENKIRGKANEVVGAVRNKAGEVTGNEEMEAKGEAQQLKGKAQGKVGDAQEKVGNAKDKLKDAIR